MKKQEMDIPVSGGIGRRDFLVLSTTCAVGALAVGPKLLADTVAAAPAVQSLAVGYAAIYSAIGPCADAFGAGFTPADSLTSPDGAFISHGAMIRLEGIASGRTAATQRLKAVCADYEVDGSTRVPVFTWAYNPASRGGAAQFLMPLDSDQKLRILFQTSMASRVRPVQADPLAKAPNALVLTTKNEAGALPLCRGYYAVVPMYAGDAKPIWPDLVLRMRNGQTTLFRKDDDTVPFDREHVIFRIDVAEAQAS